MTTGHMISHVTYVMQADAAVNGKTLSQLLVITCKEPTCIIIFIDAFV